MTPGPTREHIEGLDGIRAVAVAAVLLHHTYLPVGGGGYLGVDMFFVLSGFLITTLLLRERETTGRVRLGRFYARRALRLYPALVVLVVLFVPFAATVTGTHDPAVYVGGAVAALTYTMDVAQVLRAHVAFSHTWSLAIEEQFYLVWPAALLALMARGWKAAAGVALGLAVLLTVLYAWFSHVPLTRGPTTSFNPLTRPSGLFLGCALAIAMRHGRLTGRRWHGAVGLTGIGAVLVAAWLWPADGLQMVYIPVVCVATALLILGLRHADGVRRLLELGPLRWVGRRSYGLYLLHLPIFAIVSAELIPSRGGRVVVQIAVSLVVCALSYRFVERPFLALKSRFESRPDDVLVG